MLCILSTMKPHVLFAQGQPSWYSLARWFSLRRSRLSTCAGQGRPCWIRLYQALAAKCTDLADSRSPGLAKWDPYTLTGSTRFQRKEYEWCYEPRQAGADSKLRAEQQLQLRRYPQLFTALEASSGSWQATAAVDYLSSPEKFYYIESTRSTNLQRQPNDAWICRV